MLKLLSIITGQRPMFQNTNDFVPFCNNDTGTNLPTQSAYLADAALPIGNQPGIARSAFVNKALRQGTTIAAVIAQYVADTTLTNVNDDQDSNDHAIPVAPLAKFNAALKILPPLRTIFTTGTLVTHYCSFYFFCASANATVNSEYTNGGNTYRVSATIAGGVMLLAQGNAGTTPAASGVLTKSSGTGDATITYYAARSPLYMTVLAVGGGGGGGGTASSAATGGAAGGGGGGGTAFKTYSLPGGASYIYSVGAAGAGGAAGNNGGGAGTASVFGAISAGGGAGGQGSGTYVTAFNNNGAAGGTSSGGDANGSGSPGDGGVVLLATQSRGGQGGSSSLGGGAAALIGTGAGGAGSGYGGGGGGASQVSNGGTQAGGAGTSGILVICEYFQ